MRIVPGARPVRSATSLIARPFTGCAPSAEQYVESRRSSCRSYGTRGEGDPIRARSRYVSRPMRDPEPILLTGASGYVGANLLHELRRRGRRVRALVRNPAPGRLPPEVDVRTGDAVSGEGLPAALDGVRTLFYLIHSMEGRDGDFAARDREAAVNVGEAARVAGVERIVYLGGVGAEASSEHLRSRAEVAE